MSVRSESCSCVVRSVAEVEEQGLASRKRKHRQKRYGRARMPRSMSLAPPNKRCQRRDRRDTGESDRGGKTAARSQLARPHGNMGKSAASGLRSAVEKKLTSMEDALGRERGGPSRVSRTKRSRIRRRAGCSSRRRSRLTANRQGRQRLGREGLREEENASYQRSLDPSQPALAS